jgi:hypothetical protein
MEMLQRSWNFSSQPTLQETDADCYIAKFCTIQEADMVWERAPWHFEVNLVAIEKAQPNKIPSEYLFQLGAFWTHIYNVPPEFWNRRTVRKIASRIGDVMDIGPKIDQNKRNYVRAKILIDITKNLMKFADGHFDDGKAFDFPIKYEGLPHFCSYRGKLGHLYNWCNKVIQAKTIIAGASEESRKVLEENFLLPRYGDEIKVYRMPKKFDAGSDDGRHKTTSGGIPEIENRGKQPVKLHRQDGWQLKRRG